MPVKQTRHDIRRQVESWLDSSSVSTPANMTELAFSMHLSVRTLRRRLAARQTTFSAVFENWRIANAKRLLRQPDLSIQSISRSLGYRYASNFERAFKRWTGSSPTDYRKRLSGVVGVK